MEVDPDAATIVKAEAPGTSGDPVLDSLRTRFTTRGLDRLVTLALVFGMTIAVLLVANLALDLAQFDSLPAARPASLYIFVLVLCVLSFAMWWVTERRLFSDGALTTAGQCYVLVFGVSLALVHALSLWWLDRERMLGISWISIWIMLQPILLPGTLRQSIRVTLLLACSVPVTMLAVALAQDVTLPGFTPLFTALVPNLAAAAMALFIAREMHQLDSEVARVRSLGSYRLQHKLGEGGMGEVWQATHHLLSRSAAIKLIQPGAMLRADAKSREMATRFFKEARAVSALTSPHSVQLFDFGVTDAGTLYIAMELLEGDDLHWIVKRHGPMPPARTVHVLLQICTSLEEAHALGLLHRDIKPANVFLCRMGLEYDYVKVLDFGIARTIAELNEDPAARAAEGTPAFMAPETLAATAGIDQRSDIYSVGCVALWMLTARYIPRGQHGVGVRRAGAANAFDPAAALAEAGVPADLSRLVNACLAESPHGRPASVALLRESLAVGNSATPWTGEDAKRWWREHA